MAGAWYLKVDSQTPSEIFVSFKKIYGYWLQCSNLLHNIMKYCVVGKCLILQVVSLSTRRKLPIDRWTVVVSYHLHLLPSTLFPTRNRNWVR